MSKNDALEDPEDLEQEVFEDENLIPGNWVPYSKPDLINKANRWATQTAEMLPVKERQKGRTVGLLAILVGCLAYAALLILGLPHYPGIMAVSFLVLLVGIWRVFRN